MVGHWWKSLVGVTDDGNDGSLAVNNSSSLDSSFVSSSSSSSEGEVKILVVLSFAVVSLSYFLLLVWIVYLFFFQFKRKSGGNRRKRTVMQDVVPDEKTPLRDEVDGSCCDVCIPFSFCHVLFITSNWLFGCTDS